MESVALYTKYGVGSSISQDIETKPASFKRLKAQVPSLKQVRNRFIPFTRKAHNEWDLFKIHINKRSKERFTLVCSQGFRLFGAH